MPRWRESASSMSASDRSVTPCPREARRTNRHGDERRHCGGGGGGGGVPAGACQLAASLLTLELKEQPEVVERGQSDCWAVPQLGSCASSGGAWRLWAARHSQSEAQPLEAQPLPGISNDPRSKSPI